MRERFGVDVQAMPADDGIVLRLPDLDLPDGQAPDVADLVALEADEVAELVTAEIGGSALFASRFRECAARALLLPRRQPGKRQPLWQQRQRAASLLQVASRFPSFPIVLETVRECLSDVFDVTGLERLMTDLAARKVRVVEVESQQPSPFARGLMFGYVAQFLYEGDSPLAERRAAALALDPSLLAELLGRGEGAALRDLLDPEAVQRTEDELQRLVPERRCADAEDVADLLRVLGPLTTAEVVARSGRAEHGSEEPVALPEGEVARWLVSLEEARRLIRVRIAGEEHWAVIEDAGRLRDGLGHPAAGGDPGGLHRTGGRPAGGVVRPLRPHPRAVHRRSTPPPASGVGRAVAHDALRRLQSSGRARRGRAAPGRDGAGVLRRRRPAHPAPAVAGRAAGRRRTRPAARPRAVPARLAGRQHRLRSRLRGVDGVLRAVEQLAGAVVPASAVEPLVLAARVEGYSPAMLDELTAAGEVVWSGHGSLPGDDGWVSLHPADLAPLTLPDPAGLRGRGRHRGAPGGAGGPGRRWGVLLPRPVRRGGFHRRPGPDERAVGPGVGRAADQRHPRPAAQPPRRAAGRTSRGPRRRARATPARGGRRAGCAGRGWSCPRAAGRPRRRAAGRCCRRSRPTRRCAPTPAPRCCWTATGS